MFGKKKKRTLFSAVDDGRTVVHDFLLRATRTGFESYRTAEYRLYHKLKEEEMMPRLDEHLDKLFAGNVDDANGDMLDTIIFGAAREARADLDRQYCNHSDMLRRLIIRRKADREDLRRIRDDRAEEYEAIKTDSERTRKLLNKTYEEV